MVDRPPFIVESGDVTFGSDDPPKPKSGEGTTGTNPVYSNNNLFTYSPPQHSPEQPAQPPSQLTSQPYSLDLQLMVPPPPPIQPAPGSSNVFPSTTVQSPSTPPAPRRPVPQPHTVLPTPPVQPVQPAQPQQGFFRRHAKGIITTLGILTAGYQLFGPSTTYDIQMAKHVWCDPVPARAQPVTEKLRLSDPRKDVLDPYFVSLHTGDKLTYGNLTLEATDSRPQDARHVSNKRGDLTNDAYRLSLGCPGYVKFNIFQDGTILPGGEGIEIVYASKFLTNSGYPDFTLEDLIARAASILPFTYKYITRQSTLDRAIGVVNTQELARREAEEKRLAADEKKLIADHYDAIKADAVQRRLFESCQKDFKPGTGDVGNGGSYFNHRVQRGESKVLISRAFNDCNDAEMFYPLLFASVDTVSGSQVCDSFPRNIQYCFAKEGLTPRELVYVVPGKPRTVLERVYGNNGLEVRDSRKRGRN